MSLQYILLTNAPATGTPGCEPGEARAVPGLRGGAPGRAEPEETRPHEALTL